LPSNLAICICVEGALRSGRVEIVMPGSKSGAGTLELRYQTATRISRWLTQS
jgi:hypothetical protein